MKKRTLFHLLLAISVSGNILAGNAHERCKDDQLSQSAAQGRIAWAKKCGLIDDIDSNYYLAKKKYPVFNEKNAPTDPNAPCENLTPLADCVFGCYPGHQKVLFSDGFIPIATAYTQDKMEGLFSLSKFAHLDNLFLKRIKFLIIQLAVRMPLRKFLLFTLRMDNV